MKLYKWEELSGKTLEISVISDEGVTLMVGYCKEEDKSYALDVKIEQ